MEKLLLTLTLLAISSGVLCSAEQNLTDIADTENDTSFEIEAQLSNVVCKQMMVCSSGSVRDDYLILQHWGAFKLHNNPWATWYEAREICTQEGAQLVVINSNSEAKMLGEWLTSDNITAAAWIGTHDLFGRWETLNGESLSAAGYDKWMPGEPNNAFGNEHCGTLVAENGMNDLTCNKLLPFFCKMNIH